MIYSFTWLAIELLGGMEKNPEVYKRIQGMPRLQSLL